MNARVYDSDIGRFLSADTIIQDPHDSQSYNRYSYVRNNPLKYTDPSGNSWWTKFRDKWVKPVLAIVVAVVISVYAPQFLGAVGTFGNALAGFASGAIITGDLMGAANGALWGAISAGAAFGVGHGNMFSSIRSAGAVPKAILHGLSRTAISKLQYGSGKGSFLSGFASSLLGGGLAKLETNGDIGGKILKVTMAAIAGGTASAIGGGKFANGAMSGAFIMLFNDLANTYPSKNEMYRMSQSEWKIGDKGMYKTLMVNGVDTGRISAFNAYSSGSSDQWLYDLNIQIDRGTLMTLASLGLIAGGAVSTGGLSWVFWGAGAGLDGYSIYAHRGDITYGLGSMAIPPTGRVGSIWATGNTIYNSNRD